MYKIFVIIFLSVFVSIKSFG
ncbi:MAG: hypothetical protein RIQ89_1739, partial [Bacteroidota bacterium]